MTINYTGKKYGTYGKFFTLTLCDKGYKEYESEPFIQVDDFPKTITLNMFKHFLGDTANLWIDFFGEDIVKRNLKLINPRNFLTYDYVEDKGSNHIIAGTLRAYRGWLYGKRTSHIFTEYKGEWKREYHANGYAYIHLSQYRTWEKTFMEKCLLDKFPYLSQFEFDAYGFTISSTSIDKNELYIKALRADGTKGSLYVPLIALKNNDYSKVENRMTTYFNRYYAGEDRKKFLVQELSMLESPEAAKLKSFLTK